MVLEVTAWVFLQWRIAGVVGIQIADFVVLSPRVAGTRAHHRMTLPSAVGGRKNILLVLTS
jgi:hypothetical protein